MKAIVCFLCVLSATAWAQPKYTVCIEGGGSKTLLQVVNEKGDVVPLIREGITTNGVVTSGSNINVVGEEGVKTAFRSLFEGTSVLTEQMQLTALLPHCRVVAGMAGVAVPERKAAVLALLEEWGIPKTQISLMNDAEMALQLIGDQGIVLVSGTGSVCFGKKQLAGYRVGGLGKVLGDEGSGYQIGLHALKAALAEEYGWGAPTSLTPALREFFGVVELKTLIRPLGVGELSAAKVASVAPVVFEKAHQQDPVAQEIISQAAHDLGMLLETAILKSGLHDCEVHLHGGVFTSKYSPEFIQEIYESSRLIEENRLKLVNQSDQNIALLFAQTRLD